MDWITKEKFDMLKWRVCLMEKMKIKTFKTYGLKKFTTVDFSIEQIIMLNMEFSKEKNHKNLLPSIIKGDSFRGTFFSHDFMIDIT